MAEYPFAQVLQALMRKNEMDTQRNQQPGDNVVNALQTLATGYANNQTQKQKTAQELDLENRKIKSERSKTLLDNLLKGNMSLERPDSIPMGQQRMGQSPLDLPNQGAMATIGQPRPYQANIDELLSGQFPSDVTMRQNTPSGMRYEYNPDTKQYEPTGITTGNKTNQFGNTVKTQIQIDPAQQPTDDEFRTWVKADIMGLGAPSFGMSANNPNRSKYQRIKAQVINEMGGAESAAGKRTEIMANRSASLQGAKTEGAKVGQATHLINALSQVYDPKTDQFNIPDSMHAELALGVARLMSPSGQVGVELMDEIRQKTAREGLSSALIYIGVDPSLVGGPTQSVANFFAHSIVRQGRTAEEIRNQYTGGKGPSFEKALQNTPIGTKYPIGNQQTQPQSTGIENLSNEELLRQLEK